MTLASVELSDIFQAEGIHVWVLPIVASEDLVSARVVLDEAERNRSTSFRSDFSRRTFESARIALRTLLGGYLRIKPGDVKFAYSETGKPRLLDPVGLHFSVGHSRDRAVLAFAFRCEIGVDIEHVESIRDRDLIAKSFLTEAEADVFYRLPEDERQRGFYQAWTRKEAYLKATGQGLSGLPGWCESQFGRNTEPRSKWGVAQSFSPVSCWSLQDLIISGDYMGSVVYGGLPRSSQQMNLCVD